MSNSDRKERKDDLSHCPLSTIVERRCYTVNDDDQSEKSRLVCDTLKRVLRNCPGRPPIEVETHTTTGESPEDNQISGSQYESMIDSFLRDPFLREPFGSMLDGFFNGIQPRDPFSYPNSDAGEYNKAPSYQVPPAPHRFYPDLGIGRKKPQRPSEEELDAMRRAARNPDADLV